MFVQSGQVDRRSFWAHSTFAAFARRSLAEGLNPCSAPWGERLSRSLPSPLPKHTVDSSQSAEVQQGRVQKLTLAAAA